MTKIGINGFGRIGRLVFRGLLDRDDLEVVAINNPSGVETAEYLLKYDTVHGRLGKDVKIDGDDLIIDGKRVHVFSDRDPEHLDWSKYGVEIVVESTVKLKDKESAGKHIKGTVKKVIITAPGKDDDATIVMGVNENSYDPETDNIISNASCTTNCLAPVVKVLNEKFHIVRGLMTTVHAYTNDQKILDQIHDDPRRARAAAMSMIPTTTGAARAVGEVLPELKGKLDGSAIRVPTPNVSVVDLTFQPKRDTTRDEVNALLKTAAEGPLKGVLGYSDEPLVSIDYNHCKNSSTIDSLETAVIDGKLVRVLSWYDNEWGFSNRMVDTAGAMGKLL